MPILSLVARSREEFPQFLSWCFPMVIVFGTSASNVAVKRSPAVVPGVRICFFFVPSAQAKNVAIVCLTVQHERSGRKRQAQVVSPHFLLDLISEDNLALSPHKKAIVSHQNITARTVSGAAVQ
jgi:hypothetical protein